MTPKTVLPTVSLLSLAVILASCSSETPAPETSVTPAPEVPTVVQKEETPNAPKPAVEQPTTPEAPAELTDDQRAAALWKKIAGFKQWTSPKGFEGLVEGDSVHGDYVRFYANGKALTNINNLPVGSIIVKEGFRDKDGPLKAITVMEKIEGFSEESGDWFFSRYDSVGTPSKVNSNSCIRCHKKAFDNDFSFLND